MADIGQLNVRVGLDSTGFQNGIGKLNQEMKKVQSEFKLASTELGKHGSELDKLRTKSDSLTKQKELQRQKVEALEKAHQKSVETKGKDAKATGDLEIKLNQARTSLVQMEQDLTSINRQIEVQSSSWYKLGKSLEPIGQSMQDIGKKMESVGKDLTKKVTLPIVGIGAAAVKIGSDFQAEMSKVQAISGATGDDLQKLTDKAKEMGASTKFSASESVQALNYMAMAGWDTNQMLDGLDGVMMLAAASGENLATVSDIVTDALTAFGMKASDAGGFADLLASASSNANTNVGMLGESFKYVAPLFGSLGYSAEDAALALGLMANAGIKGSQAGTTLRGAITRLSQPTGETSKIISQLGLEMTDAQGNMLPFKDVMDQLRGSFGNLTQEQQAQYAATLFGKEAMSGMLAVINATDEDYKKLTDATREYSGAAGEMADIMQDNLQGQLTILKSQIEGVAIEIFEILVPHLQTLVEGLQRAVEWFSNLSPATQETIVKVAALAAALGPVLIIGGKIVAGAGAIIGAFSKISLAIAGKTAAVGGASAAAGGLVAIKGVLAAAFTALTGPIGIAVAAIVGITAVGVALYKNWDTIKEKAGELKDAISERWSNIKESTAEAWENVKQGIGERWSSIKESTSESLASMRESIRNGWDNVKTATAERWQSIRGNISERWGNIKDNTSQTLGNIRENISSSWDNVKNRTSGTWDFLKTNTASAWSNIKGRIEENGGGIRGVIVTYTEGYKSVWSTALNTMDSITGGKFSAMADKVSNAFSKVRDAIQNGINRLREWNNQRVENKEATFTNRIKNITENIVSTITAPFKKNFSGTSFFQGGLTMVGELGPELIELPRGSKIYNDYQTNQIMGQKDRDKGGGLTLNIDKFVNNSEKDIEQLAYELEFYRQRMSLGKGRG
ncbi:phage tail tape measure protein [Alkaliphilus transvaalensis]|uniref:phage tail tape measure protein n=1 Tax=Alkaliphilus transvaalensis TaxID=114628 RepID=UPI000A05251C|nr:phage tail tape measure protein [Alkaliphilus transvaalensis]